MADERRRLTEYGYDARKVYRDLEGFRKAGYGRGLSLEDVVRTTARPTTPVWSAGRTPKTRGC